MSQDKPCDVINLLDRIECTKKMAEESRGKDLQDFLMEAVQMQQDVPALRRGITPVTQEEAETLIRISLITALKKNGGLNQSSFICATYAANLLMELFCKTPKYWTAFDFLEESVRKKDPYILQKGADMCFLISSFFKGRGDWRTMKLGYYKNMGIGLYTSFYYQTKREIGLHMSENFLFISDTVSQGLESLRSPN